MPGRACFTCLARADCTTFGFGACPACCSRTTCWCLNNTRVFPGPALRTAQRARRLKPLSPQNPAARDFLQGRVEVLLTKQVSQEPNEWECLVRPGRKIDVGERLLLWPATRDFTPKSLRRGCVRREAHSVRRPVADFLRDGRPASGTCRSRPTSPATTSAADRERYQTVYAQRAWLGRSPHGWTAFHPGDSRSPIRRVASRSQRSPCTSDWARFQPVRVGTRRGPHACIGRAIASPRTRPRNINRRPRATAAALSPSAQPPCAPSNLRLGSSREDASRRRSGEADLFIYPGFEFRVVGRPAHQLPPAAIHASDAGVAHSAVTRASWMLIATRSMSGYRFYSYGDCMFVE